MLYTYRIGRKEAYIIYYWQGQHATKDEVCFAYDIILCHHTRAIERRSVRQLYGKCWDPKSNSSHFLRDRADAPEFLCALIPVEPVRSDTRCPIIEWRTCHFHLMWILLNDKSVMSATCDKYQKYWFFSQGHSISLSCCYTRWQIRWRSCSSPGSPRQRTASFAHSVRRKTNDHRLWRTQQRKEWFRNRRNSVNPGKHSRMSSFISTISIAT